jgi:predicted GTPase
MFDTASSVVGQATAWVAGSFAADAGVEPDYRLLLLGATGGGKTSFLNLICNFKHVSDVGEASAEAFSEVHRLDLENSNNKMQSQTCDATVYRTYFGSKLVEIIDTPGMVDTRGHEQDKVHLKRIIDTVNKVGVLHLVVVVANGAATRLDPALECALTQVAAIMPAQALPTVMSVYTHVDSLLKLTFDHKVLEDTLKIQKIEFAVIDNPFSLLQAAKRLSANGTVSAQEIAVELQGNFVKTRKELHKFAQVLTTAKPQPTKGFKELYEMRGNIEMTTLNLVSELDTVSSKQKQVQNLVSALQSAKSEREQQQAVVAAASQTVEKWKTEPTTQHNTLCGYPQCYCNCHLSCNLEYNPACTDKSFFKQCAAMGCGGDTCKKCHHSFEEHYHNKAKWVSHQEGNPGLAAVQQKLETFKQREGSSQTLVQQAQAELAKLEQKSTDLTHQLVQNVTAFECKSNARSYRALLVSQIRVIDNWIEAKQGLKEAEGMVRDLEATRRNLQTCLDTVDRVVGPRCSGSSSAAVRAPPPPVPQQMPRRQARHGGGWMSSLFG